MPKSATPEETAAACARARRLLKLAPEVAGETIVGGVERRRRRVLVGGDATVIAAIERLAPVSNMALMRIFGG